MKTDKSGNWSLIITPKRKLLEIPFREIIRYRDLLWLLIKRDFVVGYKQTLLGPLWYLINPIFSTIVYTFIFGNLAKISTDGIPHTLFYYSGTMLWGFFSVCFKQSTHVFLSNSNIFGKVYFPRLIIPINYVFNNLIKLLIQLLMLIGFFIYYLYNGAPIRPSLMALCFPLIIIWLSAISVGAGIIISSLTTKYRDLNSLVGFSIHLAMYATPVVYPLSEIPKGFEWLAYANPVCAPIELFRTWVFGYGSVNNTMILCSLSITAVLLFLGIILFNQNEQNFIDVV